jgi:hypothetical protein
MKPKALFEKCLNGYNSEGFPRFKRDPSLTPEELKLAKRYYYKEYYRVYNLKKGKNGLTYSQTKYYQNPQKQHEYTKNYRKKNKEKIQKTNRESYYRNREKRLKYARKYYYKNKKSEKQTIQLARVPFIKYRRYQTNKKRSVLLKNKI